ncbi:hypothetical protein Bbelb_295340 [Branchiostoma belcheri]|nr:hypothetical protein Bbelb_295340 [Branchiostoma belcheri]
MRPDQPAAAQLLGVEPCQAITSQIFTCAMVSHHNLAISGRKNFHGCAEVGLLCRWEWEAFVWSGSGSNCVKPSVHKCVGRTVKQPSGAQLNIPEKAGSIFDNRLQRMLRAWL